MIDIKELEKKGYDTNQISQIVKIKEETVLDNIDKIPNFVPYEKLRQLRIDLNNSKYNPMQEAILHTGLDKGIDITLYANNKYSYDKMEIILKALIDNLDISFYIEEYNMENGNDYIDDLKIVFDGLRQNLDVKKYYSKNFNYEQKVQIKNGLESKVNVDQYADPKFNADQMSILYKALRAGFDITKMTNPEYSYEEMEMILANLKKGYDILHYITPDFTLDQIYQISKGLNNGINVNVYCNVSYSPTKMRAIRKTLEYNKNNNKNESYEIYLKVTSDEEINEIRNILKNGTIQDKENLYKKYNCL